VYIWYHSGYDRITVIHHDFPKATIYSLCKITVSHRDFDIPTVIPNTGLTEGFEFKFDHYIQLNNFGIFVVN
jgi:hypothetical protein